MNKATGNPIAVEQLNGGLRSCRGFRPSLHFVCAAEAADWPAPPRRQLIFACPCPQMSQCKNMDCSNSKLFLTNELPFSYASGYS